MLVNPERQTGGNVSVHNTLHDSFISTRWKQRIAIISIPLSLDNSCTHEKNSSNGHNHSDDNQPVWREQ